MKKKEKDRETFGGIVTSTWDTNTDRQTTDRQTFTYKYTNTN